MRHEKIERKERMRKNRGPQNKRGSYSITYPNKKIT